MSDEYKKSISLPDALGGYARRNAARFHMPGHKGFSMMGSEDGVLPAWDVTEIDGTDDLASPEGCILHTEEATAALYGARHAFLLVNGSTCGVISMLLSIGSGKRVLLARDCHKSAISGMALAGHTPVYICPRVDATHRLCGMITADDVDAALIKSPCDAVYITSPNYYGACADVSAIAAVCRAHGALLLVDCAHGAHFPFVGALSPYLPKDADMYCVSAHKTLSSLTQSAVLFSSPECRISDARIRHAITLTQTSSPSYLLMCSVDWAMYQAKQRPWEKHLLRITDVRRRIAELNGISLLDEAAVSRAGIAAVDLTRLTIYTHKRGLSGVEAAETLKAQNVVPEMADATHIVCITSPNDPDEWYDRLVGALSSLEYGTRDVRFFSHTPDVKQPAMSIREATLSDFAPVPLDDAVGRIAARAVGAYPPGIATLFPGERVSGSDIDKLREYMRTGISVFGMTDGMLYCVCE